LLADALPVTREAARAAFDLRQQLPKRIPNADAFIAATAPSASVAAL
jgi:predicted nucleic acid-binding protein